MKQFDPNTVARIRRLTPINNLPHQNQDTVIKEGEIMSFPRGSRVFIEGSQDEFVHYLLEGSVAILIGGQRAKHFSPYMPLCHLQQGRHNAEVFELLIERVVALIYKPAMGMAVKFCVLPRGWRAKHVAVISKSWFDKARHASVGVEMLPLLIQGENIYKKIERLGLPTPLLQYTSPQGYLEPSEEALDRMAKYITAFSCIAESDDERFGKSLFDDTRKFLEHECRMQKSQCIIAHMRHRTKETNG